MCQLVKVSTDPHQATHPVPIMSTVHTTTMINLQLTPAEVAAFTAALERACDCPFIAEDDCSADLERLLGALEGASDLAAA